MKIAKKVLLGGIILSVILLWLRVGSSKNSDEKQVMHCVQRGPLSITVAETGTLSSQEELKIKSQVNGRKTILFLIEDTAIP